jgi:potassium-dependent mechanosensitive channel
VDNSPRHGLRSTVDALSPPNRERVRIASIDAVRRVDTREIRTDVVYGAARRLASYYDTCRLRSINSSAEVNMRSSVIEISQSCETGEILPLKSGFWPYQQRGQPRRGLSGSTTSISGQRPRFLHEMPLQIFRRRRFIGGSSSNQPATLPQRVRAEWSQLFSMASMHPVIRVVLLAILALVSSGRMAPGQQVSASPSKPNPTPSAVPVAEIPLKAQSALDSLQDTEADVSRAQSSADAIARTVSELTGEIDARIAEDTRLLRTSLSLEELYRLKLGWRTFNVRLLASARELTQQATSLEEQLGRLEKLNKTWQATLQSVKKPGTPPPVLPRVQSVVDSVEHTRQAIESGQMHVLALQSSLSEAQARVRTTLSSIEQAELRAMQHIFVRDSPPIWNLASTLGTEWQKHSSESFASQLNASAAFTKRLPYTFLIHALFIALMATALHWLQRRIGKSAEGKPDLQRALPILDLPVSTAFTLSILIIPAIYVQAPRLIHAIMGVVTLIPAVVVLQRLLLRHAYPILNAIVILYFVGQFRVLAAPLPVLARFIFLGQVLGASVFLLWLLRSWHLPTEAEETHGRVWRTIRALAKIGLALLPVAFLANIFGYVNLGNLLGTIFLRSVYVAAMLYTAIRIIEGLLIIALQVRPLHMSRAISQHRLMIQRRTCRLLEFLAFLFWLGLLLNFFGLLTPLIATTEAALNTNLAIRSFNITLGDILVALIAVWASFLVSKFVRFLLEEDVYNRLHLASGIPYAISTVLHYAILLLGFFVALSALGIDLTKLTILIGAFTVGIGFGLQNIINNFVSGLILLFERPIKIGDVIEAGGNVGEVRRIGIRASVIRTLEGSEIIVPNGSFISGQVTNWTLSDRLRAVEVSVNVSGDTDPQRVAELLKNTAAAHPSVEKEPSPQVYVTNFSAGAVTYQLRAWTDRQEDWAQLRSDLWLAVKGALAHAKIAIT